MKCIRNPQSLSGDSISDSAAGSLCSRWWLVAGYVWDPLVPLPVSSYHGHSFVLACGLATSPLQELGPVELQGFCGA